MSSKTLRIGLIGAGPMAAEHARNLGMLGRASVTAVADPSHGAPERLAAEIGASCADVDSLIHGSNCDAILIASPDDTHACYALAAIEARKPVFCEKPLGVTSGEARSVFEAELDSGRRLLQLGFMRVYDQAHQEFRAKSIVVGRPQHVHVVHRNRNENIRTLDKLVSQSLVHDLHIVRWLTNAHVERVFATWNRRADGRGVRFLVVTAKLSNGAIAVVEFDDYGDGYEVLLSLTGPKGTVYIDRPVSLVDGEDWFTRFRSAYAAEIQIWVNSLVDGVAVGPSTWDGFATQVVSDAVRRSLSLGRSVDVPMLECPDMYLDEIGG